MIRGLPHRCSIWRPTATPPDAYGQPAPAAYALGASGVRCRFSAAQPQAPRLLLPPGAVIDPRDRITDVQTPGGATVDAGPFAVQEVITPQGRAASGYHRLTLRRLVGLDQE